MGGESSSSSSQRQESLSAADESILSAEGGSSVLKVSNVSGGVNVTQHGIASGDAATIFKAYADAGRAVADSLQQQIGQQASAVQDIAKTATATQTEQERIVNRLIVPGTLVALAAIVAATWKRGRR